MHALTYFHNVYLPANALLGEIDEASDVKVAFFDHVSRVICGTLLMGTMAVSTLRISSYIAARYSLRRKVTDQASSSLVPIMSFSTQAIPILTAIAEAYVIRELGNDLHAQFTNPATPAAMRHFVATIFKVTSMRMAMATGHILEDRCGAQGLFNVNQISALNVRTPRFGILCIC
jgi:acyl-CoA oxidase